jgi:hypothetical protein
MEESTKPAKNSPITPSDDPVVDLVVALQQKTSKIDMLQAENLALKAQLGAKKMGRMRPPRFRRGFWLPARKLSKAKKLDVSLDKVELLRPANKSKAAPSWSASSWLSSLMLVQTLSAALLDQTAETDSEESTKIKRLSRSQISRAVDIASIQIKELLYSEVEKLQRADGQVLDASALSDKFAASGDSFTFTYGSMDVYHGGLETLIGAPNPNIM